MQTEYLFVYGTLMRAVGHPMHRLLQRHATCLGRATCPGRLYRVAHYPGLVPAEGADDRVRGEVYRLTEPAVLATLDEYEGCDPDPTRAEYRREAHRVTRHTGETLLAWVYLYNHPTDHLPRIPSGDYLTATR